MRSKIKFGIFGLALAGLIASCSTSNDVVSNRSIQKRKYNDGYYISFNKNKHNRQKDNKVDETVVAEDEFSDVLNRSNEVPQLNNPDVKEVIDRIEVEEVGGYLASDDLFPEEPYKSKEEVDVNLSDKEEYILPSIVRSPRNFIVKRKSTIKHQFDNNSASNGDVMLIILVILAIIIPPLAVFLYEGVTTRFWIDLILALLGIGIGPFFYYAGAFFLAAIIYALLIVLGAI